MNATNNSYVELRKSKFYGYIFNISNEEEIELIIRDIKEKNKKARHVVYAYILNNKEKLFSDKEPNGTVYPLLDILHKKNANNKLVVVVRYFGGTLLGTGPLTRCYSKATSLLFTNEKE